MKFKLCFHKSDWSVLKLNEVLINQIWDIEFSFIKMSVILGPAMFWSSFKRYIFSYPSILILGFKGVIPPRDTNCPFISKGLFQLVASDSPITQQAMGAPEFPVSRLTGVLPRPRSSRPSCICNINRTIHFCDTLKYVVIASITWIEALNFAVQGKSST